MSPHLPPSLLQMLRPTSPECIDKSTSDRHFVTWTDQEDDILRQAVTTYGVDKWSVIAAQFTNKTSRQCRRRWHTYLVTDCKKGGWSPEEDQLLLEAHQRFGNRWTEIAKMVPGRTDNAVKNRFSALGKKQAKRSNVCNNMGADAKVVSKRRALESNSGATNKRHRGDYSSYLSCNYNLQQQKQHQIQAKQSLQTWTSDQSMANRAHPVHNEKLRKDQTLTTTERTLQDSKSLQSKVSKCANVVPVNRSLPKSGLCVGALQTSRSFSENISPPRLAALTQNAALLDSLVERRDARLKLWGSIDDAWKSFDWFTMEASGKILQPANFTCKIVSPCDIRTSLYKGKENYMGYGELSCESQIPVAAPISQESINQHKNLTELGTATPTIQHERAWKVRSSPEGLDCSSPSDEINYQADASTPLQSDGYSSLPVDQLPHADLNEAEPRVACGTECQGLHADQKEDSEAATAEVSGYKPSALDPWDSHFFLDDMPSPEFSDMVGAEFISTYILVFSGCGAAMVDVKSAGAITHLGVALAFGLVVMIMIYAVGHISGAHMNPAVTLAFATVRHFPWRQVPPYIGAQVVGSICASFSLRSILGQVAKIGATLPAGSETQSLALELITSYILMFVVSGVATDTHAIGELAGLAIGAAVGLDAIFAGPISGASMNPARSIGRAVASNDYRSIWVYIVGPGVGCLLGAWSYNLIRLPPTPNIDSASLEIKSFKSSRHP